MVEAMLYIRYKKNGRWSKWIWVRDFCLKDSITLTYTLITDKVKIIQGVSGIQGVLQ